MAAPSRRWQLAGLLLTTLACMACNPLTATYFLLVGMDPKFDPAFKLWTGDKKKPDKVVILNKEQILVASTSKVQKFKDEHPSWQSLSLEEIGKKLDTDYIIELEIRELSLYENGSQNTFFKGRAAISVTVADIRKPGKNPVFSDDYIGEFPKSQGPRLASDTNPQRFRREFMTRVATDLSWLFTAHPTQDQYKCE
jgi:hypothetical protein